MRIRHCLFSLWLLLALLILISAVTLTACSTDQTQAAGSTPTPTATAMFRHPGGSTPGAVPTLPVHAQNCGTISLLPNGKLADAGLAQKAGNCFWQAYQHCQSAGLFVQVGGIDTVTTHTLLTTKRVAGCMISDIASHRIVPQPPRVATYTCAGMTNTNGVLHITGCGAEGEVQVPIQ